MFLATAIALAALRADVDLSDRARFGTVISEDALLRCSSTSPWDEPEFHMSLLGEGHEPFAFHTAEEAQPWVQVDLGRVRRLTGVAIRNRTDGNGARTSSLRMSVSTDGAAWNEVATADGPAPEWNLSLLNGDAPREARYLRVALGSKGYLHLSRLRVYGKEGS